MELLPPDQQLPSKIILVEGNSMAPYLKSDDLRLWEDTTDFLPGDILILQSEGGPDYTVHRSLGAETTTGDREKWSDQRVQRKLGPAGRVVGRLLVTGQNHQSVRLTRSPWVRRVSLWLSRMNCYDLPIVHRLAGSLLKLFSRMVRKTEDRFYKISKGP